MNTTAPVSDGGGVAVNPSAADMVSTGCGGASRNIASPGSASDSPPLTTRGGLSSST